MKLTKSKTVVFITGLLQGIILGINGYPTTKNGVNEVDYILD